MGNCLNAIIAPTSIAGVDSGSPSLDFNDLIPIPENVSGSVRDAWMMLYWGCRSNAYGVGVNGSTTYFCTLDTPPLTWLIELSSRNPGRFEMYWFEPVLPSAGRAVVEGGLVIDGEKDDTPGMGYDSIAAWFGIFADQTQPHN